MRILFFSPAFPPEMPRFVRALSEAGVEVVGAAPEPEERLAPELRRHLAGYVRFAAEESESQAVERIRREAGAIERVECLWEPGVLLAARLREALGLPGMGVEQATRFRDKEEMKRALDRGGVRTPAHARCASEDDCREAAERIGYPLIVKPISGAGSADTHRVESRGELESILPRLRHVPEVSVEEFIDGEEFTFDTLCSGGEILFHNTCWYRPRVLVGRSIEWTSPQTIGLRDPEPPELIDGVRLGRRVIQVLGFDTGYTHMEWFLSSAGEAVFGEIAARPPGARSVEVTNVAAGIDTYRGFAEIVRGGKLDSTPERRFNSAIIFKRARGEGRIRAIMGLERLVARYRPHIVDIDLLPPGAPRRNWKQTLLSDGWVMVRHPDLQATLEMADRFGTDLTLFAG